ncbi:hypothetical protein A4G99_19620 [Haladaptatus sp. R4]|nr:hypothetical protein A4G99_19620 [Haladaptatus sp. R4]
METKWMTNRIILAPNAGEEQREKLEDILDRIGINYGVEEKDDLEIIESSLHGPSRSETHEYDTEFAGQDNYEKTMDYLNDQHRKILENTEEEWSVVDLVMLFMEKAGVMVEGYRYSTDDPDIELNEYGHMKLQGVCATRNFVNGKDSITYKNDKMVEFEE